jgi:hypothetical protein
LDHTLTHHLELIRERTGDWLTEQIGCFHGAQRRA